ncbi:hypothetical protein S245_030981, partial [Arachis hypogaea]
MDNIIEYGKHRCQILLSNMAYADDDDSLVEAEGIKEGWYDGRSIAFAVILVIVVTATSDYKQSLQFRDLNEEKRNIHLEV